MSILNDPPIRFSRTPRLAYLVGIALLGTIPIHGLVPALPGIAAEFNVSASSIQLTVTAYLFGLAVGQLIIGTLSDRFGRRPVLLVGMLLFAISSTVAALAPNAGVLTAARVFQAFGACSGLVLGRAITRDIAGPAKVASSMAILSAATTAGPALSPIIGGQIAELFNWRGIFFALLLMSATLLLITVAILPETHRDREPIPLHKLYRNWETLLRSRNFMRIAIGGAFVTTSFYGFVAAAPFVLNTDFNMTTGEVGFIFMFVVAAISAGMLTAGRLSTTRHTMSILRYGVLAMCAVSVGLLVIHLNGASSVLTITVAMAIFSYFLGLCSPISLAAAVNIHPEIVGASSGLYGCFQMSTGGLIVFITGILPFSHMLAMVLVLIGASVIGLIAYMTPAKKDSAP